MTVEELKDALEVLISDGKGDLDVVVFDSQYHEGDVGHSVVSGIDIFARRPLDRGEAMTLNVVVIDNN